RPVRILRTGQAAGLERALCAGSRAEQRNAGALRRPVTVAEPPADRCRHAGRRIDARDPALAEPSTRHSLAGRLPTAVSWSDLLTARLAFAEFAGKFEQTARNLCMKMTPRGERLCKPARAYP